MLVRDKKGSGTDDSQASVEVNILGPLEKPGGKSKFSHPVKPGATVAQLLAELGYKPEHHRLISVMVNDGPRQLDDPLKGGDKVYLSLLVGGG